MSQADGRLRPPEKERLPSALNPSLAHARRNKDGSCSIHELEEHLCAAGEILQCVIARRDPKWQGRFVEESTKVCGKESGYGG